MPRRALRGEELVQRVIDKSYLIINKALSDKSISYTEKRKIALELAKKTAPKQVDIGENLTDSVTSLMKQYWLKKKEGKEEKKKPGRPKGSRNKPKI